MKQKISTLWPIIMLVIALISTPAFADFFDTTTQFATREFNHIETGFLLTGGHQHVECETCHLHGIFKGTPRNCAGCHSKGKLVIATLPSPKHFVTNEPCEYCHNNNSTFYGARFNHAKAQLGSCSSCHNGVNASGKPANHSRGLRTSEACDRCHRTTAWFPNTFNHSGSAAAPGNCAAQCHNDNLATGRPHNHSSGIKAVNSCDVCHHFSSWLPTFYNHSAVASGTCINCHNSVTATGKPSNHTGAKATMVCDNCHRTAAWIPATYNHLGVAPGSCSNCHIAQRPASHTKFGFNGACDNCHSTSNWNFNHAKQQGQHTCNSCHSKHHNETPCDYCHSVNGWGGH